MSSGKLDFESPFDSLDQPKASGSRNKVDGLVVDFGNLVISDTKVDNKKAPKGTNDRRIKFNNQAVDDFGLKQEVKKIFIEHENELASVYAAKKDNSTKPAPSTRPRHQGLKDYSKVQLNYNRLEKPATRAHHNNGSNFRPDKQAKGELFVDSDQPIHRNKFFDKEGNNLKNDLTKDDHTQGKITQNIVKLANAETNLSSKEPKKKRNRKKKQAKTQAISNVAQPNQVFNLVDVVKQRKMDPRFITMAEAIVTIGGPIDITNITEAISKTNLPLNVEILEEAFSLASDLKISGAPFEPTRALEVDIKKQVGEVKTKPNYKKNIGDVKVESNADSNKNFNDDKVRVKAKKQVDSSTVVVNGTQQIDDLKVKNKAKKQANEDKIETEEKEQLVVKKASLSKIKLSWRQPDPSTQPEPQKYVRRKLDFFEKHLKSFQIQRGLGLGTLFEATLRINSKHRSHGYATIEGEDNDLFILGEKLRNRAFEGDTIIVEIFDEAKRKEMIRESRDVPETVKDRELRFAKVVAITNKVELGQMVGIIEPMDREGRMDKRNNGKNVNGLNENVVEDNVKKDKKKGIKKVPKHFKFRPFENILPIIYIPAISAPPNFFNDPDQYRNQVYIAKITDWPAHCPRPFGELVKKIGLVDAIDCASDSILAGNSIDETPFKQKVLDCLPSLPFVIPEAELSKRVDYRGEAVFTIDPPTARDLDDAISIRTLPNGNFHVAVHIADVSYFVQPESALDLEARQRSTTVYLIEKNVPMLPRVLCDDLCSLAPFQDRLSFTFCWEMDHDANISNPKFFKSVIRSRAKLSYDHAQHVIEGGKLSDLKGLILDPNTNIADLDKDILTLLNLTMKMRKRRYDSGALSVGSVKLSFKFDDDLNPLSVSRYQIKQSNQLIEELMLQANNLAAQTIYKAYPSCALLRCHPPPNPRSMEEAIFKAKCMGITIDPTSSLTMQQSMSNITNERTLLALRYLMIRPMQRAKYVLSTGLEDELTKCRHYALNMDHYTHFTSPIRRYPDLIVHRQLQSILLNQSEFNLPTQTMLNLISHSNKQKENSRRAQDQSAQLFLAHYINNQIKLANGTPLKLKATIIEINQDFMYVVALELGLEKRIYFKDLSLVSFNVNINDTSSNVKLNWKPDQPKRDDSIENDSIQSNNSNRPAFYEILDDLDVNVTVNLRTLPPVINIVIA